MNCDEAIEFLPWLLNGTLDARERDEVRQHLATCERCLAALDDTREAWTIFGQHLASEALVALAYGEVPAGIEPAVAERHLAACPECAAELELARTSRHLEEDDKIAVFPGVRPRQENNSGSRSWRAAALAATFAGLVAGTGWIYEIRQKGDLAEQLARKPVAVQESRPTAPAPSPPVTRTEDARQVAELEGQVQELGREIEQAKGMVAELQRQPRGLTGPMVISGSLSVPEARDVVRGGEAKEIVVAGNQHVTLNLGTEADDETPRSAEILGAGDVRKWEGNSLRRDASRGEYHLLLPARSLDPGRYTIQLYTTENGGKRSLRESYKIRVE